MPAKSRYDCNISTEPPVSNGSTYPSKVIAAGSVTKRYKAAGVTVETISVMTIETIAY
jgi:hypothetical protein